MFYINQYIRKQDGTTTKAAYEKETIYDAKAEFYRRQGNAMSASDTVWTMALIIDEDGAVHMSDKCVKPVAEAVEEPAE